MKNHFDNFLKGYLKSNQFAKNAEDRARKKIGSTKKGFDKKVQKLQNSDAQYMKEISFFCTEFFLTYNHFLNILQKMLITDEEISLFSQHLVIGNKNQKLFDKVKTIQNLDIVSLVEMVNSDSKFKDINLNLNLDHLHSIRQMRNILSHHDFINAILSFQIQSLKGFVEMVNEIKVELEKFKIFPDIPLVFEDTQMLEITKRDANLKMMNNQDKRLLRP